MDIEDRVRDQIGAEGPQLPSEAYRARMARIDEELEHMSNAELLRRISMAIEERLGELRADWA